MSTDDRARFLEGGTAPGLPAAERRTLERARRLLATEEVWAEPPSSADEVATAIGAEAAAGPVAGGRRRPGRLRLVLVSTAAVALAVLGALAVVAAPRGDDRPGREAALVGTELAPDAAGTVAVEVAGSGVAFRLEVEDLPPAPSGAYYQGWVKGPDGLVTIGTFHLRDAPDPVELWSGVPVDRYPTLTVTLQEEGAGAESSGRVVLTADLGG